MKLTASLTSPYARKVRILLAEKHIDYELIVDAPWETDGGVATLNPLGKVPSLESDEGEIFYDAPMIEGFLEAIERPPHFIPEDGMAAVRVRHTEALADGILDAPRRCASANASRGRRSRSSGRWNCSNAIWAATRGSKAIA